MAEKALKSFEVEGLSPKSRRIAFAVTVLIRAVAATLRWRVHDRSEILKENPDHPLVWVFWHNRVFVLPPLYKKYLTARSGAVLSSASKDGEIIAGVMSRWGIASVRGSTSRRGAAALLGLLDWIRSGYDVGVVPDGPRGPRYCLSPGVIKLAGLTEAKILPMRVEYGSYWHFKSWDRFRVPKPFTTVDIFLDPLFDVPKDPSDEELEAYRAELETIMNPEDETD